MEAPVSVSSGPGVSPGRTGAKRAEECAPEKPAGGEMPGTV